MNISIPDESIEDAFNKQTYLGNQFNVSLPGVSLGNTNETNIMTLSNPAGSGKNAFCNLRRFSADLNYCLFKIYSQPTITVAGGAVTPVNLRPASKNAAVSVAKTTPTTSANGTLMVSVTAPTSYYVTTDTNILLMLDPGQSILVTATAVGATKVNVDIGFYEI